jgi:tetratricopeptide (TPR) repeat protein
MKLLSTFLILILVGCAKEQKTDCNYITDYYPQTAKAEVEFYSGNYEKAYGYYQKAFEYCDAIAIGTHHDTFIFSKVCAELGKDDLAIDYMEKTLSKGRTLSSYENDKIFESILKTERGQNLISNYDKIREQYLSSLNMDLRSEIQAMIEIDQKLVGQQEKRDSVFKVNDKRLVEIFHEIGYPNEQVVGNFGVDFSSADPRILLFHTDDSIRINYFIPKIKEFVKNGQCSPITLGSMYDNLELFNKQPQTHGTYESQNGGYSNMISDLSKVNANRAEIGLPSLKMTKKIDSLKRQ